jgi:hypothetical protein
MSIFNRKETSSGEPEVSKEPQGVTIKRPMLRVVEEFYSLVAGVAGATGGIQFAFWYDRLVLWPRQFTSAGLMYEDYANLTISVATAAVVVGITTGYTAMKALQHSLSADR